MKTETMQIKILTPSENHYLFNEKEKIISEKVFLGVEANGDDWREITAEEKEALEKELEEEMQQKDLTMTH